MMYTAILLIPILREDPENQMNCKMFNVSFHTLYKDDIDMKLLKIQLNLMPSFAKDININSI